MSDRPTAGHWTLNPGMKVQVFLAQLMKFYGTINEKEAMLSDENRRTSLEQWLRIPIIKAVVAFANKRHTIKKVSIYSLINTLNLAIRHNKVFAVSYVNDYLLSVLQLFKKQGFIYDYFVLPESYFNVLSLGGLSPAFSNRLCVVYLRYSNEHGLSLRNVKLLSKPSRQVYVSLDELCELAKPDSIADVYILNTVKGVMTHNEALKEQIGGNVIALVT